MSKCYDIFELFEIFSEHHIPTILLNKSFCLHTECGNCKIEEICYDHPAESCELTEQHITQIQEKHPELFI